MNLYKGRISFLVLWLSNIPLEVHVMRSTMPLSEASGAAFARPAAGYLVPLGKDSRGCLRGSIAAAHEPQAGATELSRQVRSQTKFGNEGNQARHSCGVQ